MNTRKSIPIRRKAREWTLCLLYQWDMCRDDLTRTAIENFRIQVKSLEKGLETRELKKIQELSLQTYFMILEKLDNIDRIIEEKSYNWSLDRMAVVERNIMRIAVYEMRFGDIPVPVSINEAIEIAKLFGSEDSGRFVNGILDKISKESNLFLNPL